MYVHTNTVWLLDNSIADPDPLDPDPYLNLSLFHLKMLKLKNKFAQANKIDKMLAVKFIRFINFLLIC